MAKSPPEPKSDRAARNPKPSKRRFGGPPGSSPVDVEIHRCLMLLRSKIHQSGMTQTQIQQQLGWGTTYVSQLLTRHKALRLEQLLLILSVIGVDPAEFFCELHASGVGTAPPRRAADSDSDLGQDESVESDLGDPGTLSSPELQRFQQARLLVNGLMDLLLKGNVISDEDLSAAIERRARESRRPGRT